MTVKDMEFRFIIPQWDEEDGGFVPCLEPDTRSVSKCLCDCEYICGDSYALGYVRAEEMLLDHELLAEKFNGESYLQWAVDRYGSGKSIPLFLKDADKRVGERARITALALYRMVVVYMNHECYGSRSHSLHCQYTKIAERKLSFYFLLPSLGFEIEDDAYNYSPRIRSRDDLSCDRVNVSYGEFVKEFAAAEKDAAERKEQERLENAIRIVIGNVEDVEADAVVNAANEQLAAGSGICGAIFRKAGYGPLQSACDKVAPCPTGEARITPAFGIANAKYIIHAVGPRFVDGDHGEEEKLACCYRNVFRIAVENGCKSVAVPSISTGIFGYPLEEAVQVAVQEAKKFVKDHKDITVVFVVWGGGSDGGAAARQLYEETMKYGMSEERYWREQDEFYENVED